MTDIKLTNQQEQILWQLARQRLATKRLKPRISSDLVTQFRDHLPDRKDNESLGDWLRRASHPSQSSATVTQLIPKTAQNTELLSSFMRLAADSQTDNNIIPLPETALESTDGQFRISVFQQDSMLEITIQTLGPAVDRFGGCRIGLASAEQPGHELAECSLDQDGDGTCLIKDSPDIRRVLLNPVLVLLQE